jgi:hypothetical protein
MSKGPATNPRGFQTSSRENPEEGRVFFRTGIPMKPRHQKKTRRKQNMGDFVQSTNVKSAVRKLANPIADADAFNTIVQAVITSNPFGCIAYMSSGANHAPVEKTKEAYTARILYEDTNAKVVGTATDRFTTLAGYNAGITAIMANAALATANGGAPNRDADHESYSVTLKCHDPNGELYFVTLNRSQVTLTSFSDDAIRTKVETWADSVPALA